MRAHHTTPHHTATLCGELTNMCRYYHPAPPSRVTIKQERTFEGISLDQPGCSSKQVTTLSRFQLCESCFANEQAGCALHHLWSTHTVGHQLSHSPQHVCVAGRSGEPPVCRLQTRQVCCCSTRPPGLLMQWSCRYLLVDSCAA